MKTFGRRILVHNIPPLICIRTLEAVGVLAKCIGEGISSSAIKFHLKLGNVKECLWKCCFVFSPNL